LPKITLKTNGFALGTIKKGYFKIDNGEIVKIILNSDNKPLILFTKTDGKKIYYSAKDKSNKEVVNEVLKTMPNILCK
jgi:predicted aspartyl protease